MIQRQAGKPGRSAAFTPRDGDGWVEGVPVPSFIVQGRFRPTPHISRDVLPWRMYPVCYPRQALCVTRPAWVTSLKAWAANSVGMASAEDGCPAGT